MGAVDTLGKRKAFEDLKKIDGGSWAWGQRALTRISELRTLANLMARLAGNENQDAATLAEDARQHLRVAKESIEPPDGGSSRRTSGWVDRVVTNTNAAACLIIRFAPLREVQAMLPDLVAHRRRTASRRAASDQRDLDTLRGPGRPCSPQAANWGTDRSARLLLMRGQFVPGLSNLDTSAQIVAWAVVFGYAQQLFTRLVDERGQAVLQAVGGPENHNKT